MTRSLGYRRWTVALAIAAAVALLAGGALAAGVPATHGGAGHAPDDTGTVQLAASATQDDGGQPGDRLVESCAAEMPSDYDDPASDTAETVGWVDGYWYDEPIDVDASDGLSDAELDALAARTAARVEALRCLTFETVPPIEVLDREAHENRTGDRFSDVTERERTIVNAQRKTLLVVGDDTNAINVTRDLFATGVAGYYEPTTDRIVLIRPEDGSAPIDEVTLFQELGHALQDQRFGIGGANRSLTIEEENAWRAVVEGDMNFLDYRFEQRCRDGRWNEPCVLPDGAGGGGSGDGGQAAEPSNWGVALEFQYPYLEGPPLVRQRYQEGGWDAVDRLYADVPDTTLAVTSPERGADAAFVDPAIDVAPDGDWERVVGPNGTEAAEIGTAWIASAFMAPSWESDFQENVISPTRVVHTDSDGEPPAFGAITYDPAAVTGWRGDRMAVFQRGTDTATVWRTAWADAASATAFADAYRELLDYRGASAAEQGSVYTFAETSGYEGAVAVVTDGDRATIVTAPSADELSTVAPDVSFGGADSDGAGGSDGETDADTGDGAATGDEAGSGGADGNESDDGSSDGLPGFGVGVALVAALVGALLLARRAR